MDFQLSAAQGMIPAIGGEPVRTYDRACWTENARAHRFPEEMYQQIAADDFLGVTVPEACGGCGPGLLEMLLFQEGLGNQGIPLPSLVIGATRIMGLLAVHGTEVQRKADGFTRFPVDLRSRGIELHPIPVSVPWPEVQYQVLFDPYPLVRLTKTAPINNEMILNHIAGQALGLPRSY